jgi:hypothetical protein
MPTWRNAGFYAMLRRRHVSSVDHRMESVMTLDLWRDVAVIWLCFQGFFLLIIPLAIAYFLVRGINWVVRKTPPLFHTLQGYSSQMRNKTEALADKVAEPVIRAHVKSREAQAVIDKLVEDAASSPESRQTPAPSQRVITLPINRTQEIRKDRP